MIRSLKRALQPAITDVHLKFEVSSKCEVLQSPQNLPPVFNGERLIAYAVIRSKGPLKASKCTAVLKGSMLGAKQKYKIPFTLESSSTVLSLPVIHHLAAKALIIDWEAEEKEKKSIVDLSIESSVISSHTAFIAIDEESSEPVRGSLKTYDIRTHGLDLDNSSCYSCSSSDEDDECSPALNQASPPFLSQKKAKKRSAPRMLEDEFDEDFIENEMVPVAQSGVMMDKLCEEELEYELESWSEGEGQERVLKQRMEKQAATAGLANLTTLITAQLVNGSWELTTSFAQLVGKPLPELEAACPIGREGVGATVWATVLAVSLLRSRYSSQQDEWELIGMKAESWLKKQSFSAGVTLESLFQEAQKQLQ